MKKPVYSLLLMTILVLGLSSCTKDTENKLVGKWAVLPLEDSDEEWEFGSDGVLTVNGAEGIFSGIYSVEATFLETKLTIDSLPNQYNYYNTDTWVIIQLKRETLYINNDKDGGLLTREFVRID